MDHEKDFKTTLYPKNSNVDTLEIVSTGNNMSEGINSKILEKLTKETEGIKISGLSLRRYTLSFTRIGRKNDSLAPTATSKEKYSFL